MHDFRRLDTDQQENLLNLLLISSTSRRTNPRWRMANLGLQAAASSHPQSPVQASKARIRGQEEWKASSGPSETAVAPDGAAWTACEIIGRRLYYEFPFHKGFLVRCARAVAPVSPSSASFLYLLALVHTDIRRRRRSLPTPVGGCLQQMDMCLPCVLAGKKKLHREKKCTAPICVNGDGHDGHPGYFYVDPASYDFQLRLLFCSSFNPSACLGFSRLDLRFRE